MTRITAVVIVCCASVLPGEDIEVRDTAERIVISTPQLQATVNKKDYVTRIAGGSFVDRKIGFKDAGYGLAHR
jgi:hypothetical protein